MSKQLTACASRSIHSLYGLFGLVGFLVQRYKHWRIKTVGHVRVVGILDQRA